MLDILKQQVVEMAKTTQQWGCVNIKREIPVFGTQKRGLSVLHQQLWIKIY